MSNECLKCGMTELQAHGLGTVTERRRKLVYMMHPLGNASNRERNRKLACLWQAVVQEAHPEWLVLAPWIGLSGAWSEARRELGMQVDKATIDVCEMGIVTGPLDGPCSVFPTASTVGGFFGVSPGMSEELGYFFNRWPDKKLIDLRKEFKVELSPTWCPPLIGESPPYRRESPYSKGEVVYVENKAGGECSVLDVEEQAAGVFRYTIERREVFFAHEQALKKKTPR